MPSQRPSDNRQRTSSITESILNSRIPLGALAATGGAIGSSPSLAELRRDSLPRSFAGGNAEPIAEEALSADSTRDVKEEESEEHPGWWAVTKTGLRAFWGYFTTPLGFCVTIYMLNVVAWGGMLFLLLVANPPAMCHPTCNDDYSGRNVWIEIDSQILNSLFCVTGFGLIPWRFRDLYYLLKWRLKKNENAFIKLQEIHSSWFRPAMSADVVEAAAEPETGSRAPPTQPWKLDYVIWLYCWNTFFQCCLSGLMWGLSRFDRPPWSTGLVVALACLVAGMAGGQVWWEGRKVKRVENKKEAAKKEKKEHKEHNTETTSVEEEGRGKTLVEEEGQGKALR